MNFKDAVQDTPVVRQTDNGMKTLASSLKATVDMFFQVGASRGKDVSAMFERAYQEDRLIALRIAAWARDVRGGAGERGVFRNILSYVEKMHPTELPQLVQVTPMYGRWDDLLVLTTDAGRRLAFDMIKEALLVKQDGLCAKWQPRKGDDAVALRKHLGLTPKGYRKTLVTLTKVVETQMCAQDWAAIDYEHLPSVASARYQKAFGRHDPTGYGLYKEKLVSGDAKINAGAVYPYDVIKSIRMGDPDVAKAQWDALPNYIGDALVLPMVDVSGSMNCPAGGNQNVTCMDVSISLGLYLADKNTGPFKDMFLTFSTLSKIEVLKGNIVEKYRQLQRADWDMSTNIVGAFDEVLRVATTNSVKAEDMPKYMVIFSDMQFDACVKNDDSAMEMIQRKYEEAGYVVPNVIFWNLNAREGNVPVRYDESGTALVSGFSPSLMTSILKADDIDPVSIMLEVVNSERYAVIQ